MEFTHYDSSFRRSDCDDPQFRVLSQAKSVAGLMGPIADAGRDLTVMTGETLSPDGFGSRDTDGNIASYFWEQVGGDSMLTKPAQGSTGFAATETGSFTFMLTVTDNGLKAMDSCAVLIFAARGPENLSS